MSKITIATSQFSGGWNTKENLQLAESLIDSAQKEGAHIFLLPEFFATPYFCIEKNPEFFKLAYPADNNPVIKHMQKVAKKLKMMLPLSFFEKNNTPEGSCQYYNSLCLIDSDGEILGLYRKSHIPYGPGYEESFYFQPGDTGYQVWKTRYGNIGCAICWDQWYPESSRILTIKGADVIFYPSAIGSEPTHPEYNSKDHWQRSILGQAAINMTPTVTSNRIGKEKIGNTEVNFYGHAFIASETGEIYVDCQSTNPCYMMASFDFNELAKKRAYWHNLLNRRTDLYAPISE